MAIQWVPNHIYRLAIPGLFRRRIPWGIPNEPSAGKMADNDAPETAVRIMAAVVSLPWDSKPTSTYLDPMIRVYPGARFLGFTAKHLSFRQKS